jgi:hypothetical protein
MAPSISALNASTGGAFHGIRRRVIRRLIGMRRASERTVQRQWENARIDLRNRISERAG